MFSMWGKRSAEATSSKTKVSEESPLLTPPTPRVNSFSQPSNSAEAPTTTSPPSQTASTATTTRVTPPSTASPMKRPRDSTSPERPLLLYHSGSSWFLPLDPPVTDLLSAATSSSQLPHDGQTSSASLPRSSSRHLKSSKRSNNTIMDTIRQLGPLKYLQKVNLPEVLPAKFRLPVVTPDPATPAPPTLPQKRRRKAPLTMPSKGKKTPAATNTRKASAASVVKKPHTAVHTRKPSITAKTTKPSVPSTIVTRKSSAAAADPSQSKTATAVETGSKEQSPASAQISSKKRKLSVDTNANVTNPSTATAQTPPKKRKLSETNANDKKLSEAITQSPSRKRKASELQPNPVEARKSEDPVPTKSHEEPSPKKAKTAPPTTPPTKLTIAKPKSRKTPKKTPTVGTSKPEKSRTKEQRWGDYLKNVVGGEKDAYEKLPDHVIPPLGNLIDQVPVRSYTFNKGKVQDYGDSQGLHAREMELAREVGLSYNAYRQQKRMAFIGYAAMQLEGKKDFKKSHTQSMCNIDGNKATHLWVHFHDCWGWMPENPTPAITTASLGDLQLPDLNVAQPQQ